MNAKIYLDNNATTKCDERVLETLLPYLKDEYENPSSIYTLGRKIKEKLSEARKKVAKVINAKEEEIIFTSCASESNSMAIMNAVKNHPKQRHIITTKVEHASILEAMHDLEQQGYYVTYLSVNEKGQLSLEELEQAITKDTFLIVVMMANNELGNLYPIKEIGALAEKYHIYFHTDAVQALGKIKIDVRDLKITTLSLSGHKIHAPKGIGVLYVKENTPVQPLIYGHQEHNFRGGTENVAFIMALGTAAELIYQDEYQTNIKLKYLRDKMEKEIKERIEEVYIYGDLENRLPNTSSIAIKGIKGEELMLLLESFGIYVSTGSACNSEIAEPSHVLVACKANMEDYSPIRISLGKYNTEAEIEEFVKRLESIVRLKRRK